MPERTVFRGRDGCWYAVEETASGAGVRIDMTYLGSTEEVAGVEAAADEANVDEVQDAEALAPAN